ncbi:MAG: ribosomal-protein-alanine N-acetyltransferase, partial [Shewanella sp.]
YDHYRLYGFGRWSVLAQGSKQYLGFCGLKRTGSTGEVDLGSPY